MDPAYLTYPLQAEWYLWMIDRTACDALMTLSELTLPLRDVIFFRISSRGPIFSLIEVDGVSLRV